MDFQYKNYSLEELEDVFENIDRDKYPERFEEVSKLIDEKSSSSEMTTEDAIYIEEKKGIDSPTGCEKLILYGFFAGLFVTLMNLTAAILGIYNTFEQKYLEGFNDPLVFFDIALLALLTLYIYKKSRVAITLMFIYYLWAKLSLWFVDLEPKGLIVGCILIFVFFNATRATFVWHSKYKNKIDSSLVVNET
jgi:hypothetical protein